MTFKDYVIAQYGKWPPYELGDTLKTMMDKLSNYVAEYINLVVKELHK